MSFEILPGCFRGCLLFELTICNSMWPAGCRRLLVACGWVLVLPEGGYGGGRHHRPPVPPPQPLPGSESGQGRGRQQRKTHTRAHSTDTTTTTPPASSLRKEPRTRVFIPVHLSTWHCYPPHCPLPLLFPPPRPHRSEPIQSPRRHTGAMGFWGRSIGKAPGSSCDFPRSPAR